MQIIEGKCRRSVSRALGVVLLACTLAGCGGALKHWENQNRFLITAEELDASLVTPAALKDTTNNNRAYLGTVVDDSEKKCARFLDSLVIGSTTTHTGLDMITTVLTALASVFTPLSTVHGLTAGATVAGGWKTAIDADVYQKASIGNYSQAIQATYYKDISQYLTALTNMTDDKIVAALEVPKIRSIHRECSLAAAQSSISATLQPGTQGPTTTSRKLTVTSVGAAGVDFTVTAKSSTDSNLSAEVKYPVAAGDTTDKIASKLLERLNGAKTLTDANVTASAATGDSSSIILRSPTSAGITWSAQPSDKMTLSDASTQGGTISSDVTKGGTPGGAIR